MRRNVPRRNVPRQRGVLETIGDKPVLLFAAFVLGQIVTWFVGFVSRAAHLAS